MFFAAVKSIIFMSRLLPVNEKSYYIFLRQHYGVFASDLAFQYGKSQLKIAKLKCDLKFLKQCKKEDLLPTFTRFRLPLFYIRHQSVISKCYYEILNNDIKATPPPPEKSQFSSKNSKLR
jgi:hypothetical protein